MGCIYKITNKLNNKSYIGQTMQIPIKRWRAHISKKIDSAIHNAIVKYGKDNFIFEVICEADTIEELNKLEIEYIKSFNTLTPNGYNLDEGGRNCLKSKESIEKGAIKKRGKAYKNRRRGIVAIHSKTFDIIETEVVKDFLIYGFTKANLSNIRTVLAKKAKRTKVKEYYFYYKFQVNQNLIEELKKSSAVQRIGSETVNNGIQSSQETLAPIK